MYLISIKFYLLNSTCIIDEFNLSITLCPTNKTYLVWLRDQIGITRGGFKV